MKFKKCVFASLLCSVSMLNIALAGTIGTYRVGEDDIISVQGISTVMKVTISKSTLAPILKKAKPGETFVLVDSEWNILESNLDKKTLSLEDKSNAENQIDLISQD